MRTSGEAAGDESFVNSIIGEGTRFRGEFDLDGLLRIDGDFSGVVRTKGKVLVGRNGRAQCTIYAGTVVIGGAVRGDINATEKVIVLSTGMIIGNIRSPRLVIEEGVLFTGECQVEPSVGQSKPAGNQGPQQNRLDGVLTGPGGPIDGRTTGPATVPHTPGGVRPVTGQISPTPGGVPPAPGGADFRAPRREDQRLPTHR